LTTPSKTGEEPGGSGALTTPGTPKGWQNCSASVNITVSVVVNA